LQLFQASSAARTFWIAVSRVKGGSGGRDSDKSRLLTGVVGLQDSGICAGHPETASPEMLRVLISQPLFPTMLGCLLQLSIEHYTNFRRAKAECDDPKWHHPGPSLS
jgi:hypothetical protein